MQAIKTMELVKQYKTLTAVDRLYLDIQQEMCIRDRILPLPFAVFYQFLLVLKLFFLVISMDVQG